MKIIITTSIIIVGIILVFFKKVDNNVNNPSEINPSKINPSEINPSEINPSEINPSEINPSEINPSANNPLLNNQNFETLDGDALANSQVFSYTPLADYNPNSFIDASINYVPTPPISIAQLKNIMKYYYRHNEEGYMLLKDVENLFYNPLKPSFESALEMSTYIRNSNEWTSFILYLMVNQIKPAMKIGLENTKFPWICEQVEFSEAIQNGLQQMPDMDIDSMFEIASQITSTQQEIMEQEIIPITEPIIVSRYGSTNMFTDFLYSDLGQKCIIGVVTITGIVVISHIIISYYYKTTWYKVYKSIIKQISNFIMDKFF